MYLLFQLSLMPIISSPFQLPLQIMPESIIEDASEPASVDVKAKQGISLHWLVSADNDFFVLLSHNEEEVQPDPMN